MNTSPKTHTGSGGRAPHLPVMLQEVAGVMDARDGGVYVDGTFGAGGYSRQLLQQADCRIIAADRDPGAASYGQSLVREFPGRFQLLTAKFSELEQALPRAGLTAADGFMFDIGVSSMQLDQAERGFSFQQDGPLDMRMGGNGPSAADVVNNLSAGELADIIYHYGEERRARAIAKAIVRSRETGAITRTMQLAAIVSQTPGARSAPGGKHPATRTFQALRIYVNDELYELASGLMAAEHFLKPEGRLAVVSFHSLEDRIVKLFLASRSGIRRGASRHMPEEAAPAQAPSFKLLWNGARKPGAGELRANPRARSARLRAAVRTSAPALTEAFLPEFLPAPAPFTPHKP
ncbi:MAG: 16S rRNA (cytosine(1402)-N(4))-methyltransferase RsmH [Pseudomonadota bacterium]|jgi:16S rRNA (cytosine1402-N4)-methyltransferase